MTLCSAGFWEIEGFFLKYCFYNFIKPANLNSYSFPARLVSKSLNYLKLKIHHFQIVTEFSSSYLLSLLTLFSGIGVIIL